MYRVLKTFNGSPTGAVTIEFTAGAEVSDSDLGDDLAIVALDEGWIESVDDDEEPDIVIDENGNADNVPLENLHWRKLKKMIEDAGGEYTSKEEAIEALSNA